MAESAGIESGAPTGGGIAARLARPVTWLGVAAALLAGFAYRDLFGLGTRWGLAKGVEYWLFQPSDSAPLVIVAISAWLLYRRSPRLRVLQLGDGSLALALPLYAIAAIAYGWAVYTTSLDVQVISFVAFLFATISLFWGRPGIHALWLPAAFMLFAVRMPAPMLLAVIYDLQMWTAEYAGWLLYAMGETAFVSGDQIIRASQRFQVVEGCSGMRSLETLTMLTVLMADLFGRRGWHAVLLLISAPIVAFALNGIRVLTIILNPHSDIATIHNAQGIAILLVGLLLIYGFDEVLERVLPASASPPWRPTANEAADGAAPSSSATRALAGCVAASIGLLVIAWVTPTFEPPPPARAVFGAQMAEAMSVWPTEKRDRDFNFEGSARFDGFYHHDVLLPDGRVDVFVATSDPSELRASPLSPMTVHPASGFAEVERLDDVLIEGMPPIEARVMRRDKLEVLVWHAYLNRQSLAAETLRGLLAIDRSRARRPAPPTVMRLTTEIEGRGEAARDAAVKKLRRVHDRLLPVLRQPAQSDSR